MIIDIHLNNIDYTVTVEMSSGEILDSKWSQLMKLMLWKQDEQA